MYQNCHKSNRGQAQLSLPLNLFLLPNKLIIKEQDLSLLQAAGHPLPGGEMMCMAAGTNQAQPQRQLQSQTVKAL